MGVGTETLGGGTGVLVTIFGAGTEAAVGAVADTGAGVPALGVAAGVDTFFIGCCINGISGVEARESGWADVGAEAAAGWDG